jgi:hypothetical protein
MTNPLLATYYLVYDRNDRISARFTDETSARCYREDLRVSSPVGAVIILERHDPGGTTTRLA